MHKHSSAYNKSRHLWEVFGNIMLRMIQAGVGFLFGFWLLMASNMGPAYLPHIMNGELDFWIRMLLLGLGLGIWLSTALWSIWRIGRYFWRLKKRRPI